MRARFMAILAAVAATCAACGSSAPAAATPSALSGSITVFAAASLTAGFTAAGSNFQKAHAGTTIDFNFAGSPTLVAQVQQGAIGDLFASADQPNMQKLVDAGLVQGVPTLFARNKLAIVVAPGNPKRIMGLADLGRQGLVVVLCGPTVPCGRYGAQALANAGVKVAPASLETDVKSVVSKVSLGEADAGIVYVTDIKAAGTRVVGVQIPDSQNVVASYPVGVLKGTQNAPLAKAFIDYLLSADGQNALASYGFTSP
ncbi:MAG TPA: molybdate ABC transporter substrate-binding protein [Candidatus Dormibacteraeota bacterium]|nr:molybdate ABC transporter substrate-binding protein [Candidatus Dormibacteraeota bacterium]